MVAAKTLTAQTLQAKFEDASLFGSQENLKEELQRVFRVGYEITDTRKNTISGYGQISTDLPSFPRDISSLYISNTTLFRAATNGRMPRNAIDLFIDFSRPSMAINLINLPSNPTNNGSIVNVYGIDEDWVISTHQSLKEFFDVRKSKRGFIHRSGVYDLFVWGIYIPILLWVSYKVENNFPDIFEGKSTVYVAGMYIYSLVILLIFARVIFQYTRWLFPIVEYSTEQNTTPKIHRRFLFAILISVSGALIYDVIRTLSL